MQPETQLDSPYVTFSRKEGRKARLALRYETSIPTYHAAGEEALSTSRDRQYLLVGLGWVIYGMALLDCVEPWTDGGGVGVARLRAWVPS